MKLGIRKMRDEEYHTAEGLSNSYLWRLIDRTPAHAVTPFAATDAMNLGSAVHIAVLQPELAAEMIVQGPKDRRGKKWAEAKEEAEAGKKILLTEADYGVAMKMRDRVWQSSVLAGLLAGKDVKYEQAAFWQHCEWLCKCKVDAAKDNFILDLKTTADASPRGFAKSCASYGYHQQAASYRYGWGKASGKQVDHFLFLCIEKSAPYLPAIYELDAPSLSEGWASYIAAIDLHAQCEEQKEFYGYAAEKVLLQLPPYAFKHTNPRHITL